MTTNSDSSFAAMMKAIDAPMSAVSNLWANIASCHDLQNSPGKSSLLNTPMAFPFRDDFITSNSFVKFPLSLSFCEHHTHQKHV